MSGAFRALPSSDLTHAVEGLLLPSLAEALRGRGPGHCMRVSDLGPELMIALARGLRSQVPSANVHVLADGEAPSGEDLHVSSTKLVELRNPLPDGSLRPPLCVFLPANVRTSAEDSFGSATFEDFRVDDAYERLRRKLLERVPSTLRGYARDLLAHLGEQRSGPAVRAGLADRAFHADHPPQVQFTRLAETYPEGECRARCTDPRETRLPRAGRGLRMEQQGHGRRIHPRSGQGSLPSPYHAARGRNEDGGRSFGWVDVEGVLMCREERR